MEPPGMPMTAGTLIEVWMRILRREWIAALALALLFAGPGALLTAAVSARFNDVAMDVFPGIGEGLFDDSAVLTEAQLERLMAALAGYLMAIIVAGTLGSIGAVSFADLAWSHYRTGSATFASALLEGLRRTPSVVAFVLVTTLLIVGLVVAAGLTIFLALSVLSSGSIQRGGPGAFVALVVVVATVVGVVYLSVRWALAFPLMAIEGAGWRAALSRSWFLSGDNVWRTLLVAALGGIVTILGAALVAQLLAIFFVDVLAASAGMDLAIAESLVVAAGTVLLAPLSPVLMAVLSLDLKVRRDGDIGPLSEEPPATLP